MIGLALTTQIVLWAAIGLISVFLSAVYSGTETGAYRVSEVRVRVHAERGQRAWVRLRDLLAQRDRFICLLLIGNNVSNFGTTAAAAVLLTAAGFGARQAELLTTLAVTPLLFVMGEMIPKTLFQLRPDTLTVRWVWLIGVSRLVFTYTGLVAVVRYATAAVMYLFGHRGQAAVLYASRDRIRSILLDHTARGVLSPVQLDVARNVLKVRAVRTREVMTPIHRVVMVDEHATRDDIEQAASRCDFSRLVVHAAGDPRRLIGFVRVNEVLLSDDGDDLIPRYRCPAAQLDVDQPVTRALFTMQQQRCPLGVVLDRRRRAIGIATLKDLIEEITGELAT
jgi:putative hemolysin